MLIDEFLKFRLKDIDNIISFDNYKFILFVIMCKVLGIKYISDIVAVVCIYST